MRILWLKAVKKFLFSLGDPAFLILKDEMIASDDYPRFLYIGSNTMCHNIIDFRVHLFMVQLPPDGFIHHSFCHGMREMFLQAGSQSEHLVGILSVKCHHISHHRAGLCQGSGLIEYNGLCLCCRFQILAAFHCYVMSSRLAHG